PEAQATQVAHGFDQYGPGEWGDHGASQVHQDVMAVQAAHLLDQGVGGQPKAGEVTDAVAEKREKVRVRTVTDEGCPHGFAPFSRPAQSRATAVASRALHELRASGAWDSPLGAPS